MEKLLKALDVHRTSFIRIYQETVRLMENADFNMGDVQGNARMLDQKIGVIQDLDRQLLEKMLDEDTPEDDVDAEVARSDELLGKYNRLKVNVERLSIKNTHSELSSLSTTSTSQVKRNIKLPKIELIKFCGEIKNWLPFWAQFNRIHTDDSISTEDKFQYLIQATVPNSRARQLVDSYPPSAENYPKVIESLKSRFGREDLLIEVYVRELLKLILKNLNSKVKLSFLYDQIESQLRSLETLGITSDKCAAMIFPLVESCLPEDILTVWQRSCNFDSTTLLKSKLDKLMDFLRREVENEQKISLVKSSFDIHQKRKNDINSPSTSTSIPTVSILSNADKTIKCVFCKKTTHHSTECDDTKTKQLSFDEKRKILIKCGRCYLCLKFGHIARKCAVNIKCSGCGGKHASLMCNSKPEHDKKIPNSHTNTVESLSNASFDETYLQTLVVIICGLGKSRSVRAIIDTGSQRSYISEHLAVEMGFESLDQEEIVHALFGGVHSEVINHNRYRVSLKDLSEKYLCHFDALSQAVICSQIISIRDGPWKLELEKLGISISDTKDGPIEILIGADIAGKLLTGKKYVLECGLVAMETKLGWTLMGRSSCGKSVVSRSSSMMVTSLFCQNDISTLWDLDILGIADPRERKTKKQHEADILKTFLETVSLDSNGRYEVGLIWVDGHPSLANNFHSAKRRLDGLMKKLKIDGYYKDYDAVFREWLQEGIIEEVGDEDSNYHGYFLPHRHVIKLSSTSTKLRPVFDGSAKEKNHPSLNNCLEKGMNMIELISSIIIRFRLERIGVVSDIRKAFLQIGLKEQDRKFLKFLWYNSDGNLKIYRHARVVFGLTCSPFMLASVIHYHLNKFLEHPIDKFRSDIILKLRNSFYVDNCVTSVSSKDDLHHFISKSTELMSLGKFDLRGWEYTVTETTDDFLEEVISSVLGLLWNRRSDTLEVNFEWLSNIEIETITKRKILSIAHKVFDPIGFLCPVQVCPRILLQRIWILKIGWDVEVPQDIKNLFLNWLRDITFLRQLKIPRWMSISNVISSSLHMFCDASKEIYATVIFLRTVSSEGVSLQLVQAKNRIAPMKNITIPKLELLGATIGVRLLNSVLESIGKESLEVFCWTDSTTVLSWIRREDIWKPFVWNRIQEIRLLTSKDCWFHVPGHMNPADLPSRGCLPKQLLSSRWWEGPTWLKNEKDWPEQNFEVNEEEVVLEKRKCTSNFMVISKDFSVLYNYFSKYQKILNSFGWIRRFIFNCRFPTQKKEGNLSVDEIEDAEINLIRLIQGESFNGIDDEKIVSLCPFLDESKVMRIKTKITERDDMHDFIYPILLPSKHHVTESIISHFHLQSCHAGIQGVLCKIRNKFWIPSGRRTVKRVIGKCIRCRRFTVQPLGNISATLPSDRVRDASIFEIVGIDFAGPLLSRTKEKIWICIFTCAVYRAVHLEIVNSLSTESFILALRRFIARRGRPSTIYSDNGRNFVGTANCFATLNWNKIEEVSTIQRIKWKFNPPFAAWWGGWWERLIRILKQLLRRQLGRASLTCEELSSVVCDCEAVINSRPLTYLSENNKDLIPLTPSIFMQDIKEIGTPDLDNIDANSLRRHLKYLQNLRNILRMRFRNEYLSQLILFKSKKPTKEIKIGDLVLIEDENHKRIEWPLGIIEELFPGKDGRIRLVRLRTLNGHLMRPIQRLYPLEMDTEEDETLKKKFWKQREDEREERSKENESQKEILPESLEKPTTKTRSGRIVHPPDRLTF